ncbi:MAG: PA14 domain-containing protein, partial [Pseudomonadota bacterium]
TDAAFEDTFATDLAGEECDDGNLEAGDDCSPVCGVELCGNLVVDPDEGCDDGNTSSGDGCTADCLLEECGNGILEVGEQCDDGNNDAGDDCGPTCLFEECGNEFLDPGETCDDGDTTSGDGCTEECVREYCGDAVLQPENKIEEVMFSYLVSSCEGSRAITFGINGSTAVEVVDNSCDCSPGIKQASSTSPTVLGLLRAGLNTFAFAAPGLEYVSWATVTIKSSYFGDQVVTLYVSPYGEGVGSTDVCDTGTLAEAQTVAAGLVLGEECDDGNNDSGDGCSARCSKEGCGDGRLDSGIDEGDGEGDDVSGSDEECDDGNVVSGDGCSADCRKEYCGDGVVQTNIVYALRFNWLASSYSGPATMTFRINGQVALSTVGDSGSSSCYPGVKDVLSTDPAVVALLEPSANTITVELPGAPDAERRLGWALVTIYRRDPAGESIADEIVVFDASGRTTGVQRDEYLCDGYVANTAPVTRLVTAPLLEECDPGTDESCGPECLHQECGNAYPDPGETCDFGDTADGDGCSATCRKETCGDGVLQRDGRLADLSFTYLATGGSSGTQRIITFRLNGAIAAVINDTTYDCYLGWRTVRVTDPKVLMLARPGDNVFSVEAPNHYYFGWALATVWPAGSASPIEVPIYDSSGGANLGARTTYSCIGSSISMQETHVTLDSSEQCDDGNTAAGDGCGPTCKTEDCGDGILEAGEQCDDGNNEDSDGCSASCSDEFEGGSGLAGEYFNNADLTERVLVRTDSSIDFGWGYGTPDASINGETFSVRWSGWIKPSYSETYTFTTSTDDGARLWVNDRLMISDWTVHSQTDRSWTIDLIAGTRYPIVMEYYENTSSAVARLYWSSASQTRQIVPPSALYPLPY